MEHNQIEYVDQQGCQIGNIDGGCYHFDCANYNTHTILQHTHCCNFMYFIYLGIIIAYTAFHQHFGSDVTSASFAFNRSRGRGAMITCIAWRYATVQTWYKH